MSMDSPEESRYDEHDALREEQLGRNDGANRTAGDGNPGGDESERARHERNGHERNGHEQNGQEQGSPPPCGPEPTADELMAGEPRMDDGRLGNGVANGRRPVAHRLVGSVVRKQQRRRGRAKRKVGQYPALQRAYRAGSREAYERLYAAYVDRFRPAARVLCGGQEDLMEDAMQEHNVKLLSSAARATYDANYDWGVWATEVLRRAILEILRKWRRDRQAYWALEDSGCLWLQQEGLPDTVLEKLRPVRWKTQRKRGRMLLISRRFASERKLQQEIMEVLTEAEFAQWWPLIRHVAAHQAGVATGLDGLATTELGPEDLAQLRELDRVLDTELAGWDDQEVHLFILRFLCGFKYELIAELVGITKGPAARRVKDIRERLRRLLKGCGFGA